MGRGGGGFDVSGYRERGEGNRMKYLIINGAKPFDVDIQIHIATPELNNYHLY